MRPSNNMESKILSDTFWIEQLICRNVQAHSSLELPLMMMMMMMIMMMMIMMMNCFCGMVDQQKAFSLIIS